MISQGIRKVPIVARTDTLWLAHYLWAELKWVSGPRTELCKKASFTSRSSSVCTNRFQKSAQKLGSSHHYRMAANLCQHRHIGSPWVHTQQAWQENPMQLIFSKHSFAGSHSYTAIWQRYVGRGYGWDSHARITWVEKYTNIYRYNIYKSHPKMLGKRQGPRAAWLILYVTSKVHGTAWIDVHARYVGGLER